MNVSKLGELGESAIKRVGKVTRHIVAPSAKAETLPVLKVPNDTYGRVLINYNIPQAIKSLKEMPAFKRLTFEQQQAFSIIEDIGASVPQSARESFTNYTKSYIEQPSAAAFYRAALRGEYTKIRLANYPVLETEAKNISEITSRKAEGITTAPIDGWHYRGIPERKNTSIRISVNAKADEELITNLDKLVLEEKSISLYKTSDGFERWHTRHDPITIYLSEEPSEELIEKLIKATEGHIRSEENLIGKPIAKGMTLDVTPSKDAINALVDEIAQYDEHFASYLRNVYFMHGDSLNASTGNVQAAKNLLARLKQNYPEPNSFSKSIGTLSFKEDPERTAKKFAELFDEKYEEIVSMPRTDSFQPETVQRLYKLTSYLPDITEKSETLMNFIKEFPKSASWAPERLEKVSMELEDLWDKIKIALLKHLMTSL